MVWYHGRMMTAKALGQIKPSVLKSHDDSRLKSTHGRQQRSQGHHARTNIFSWNIGGLSSWKYQCLLEWLQGQSFDICCIQETHWSFTQEWQTDDFFFIHSGNTKPEAGVLTIISKKFGDEKPISWQETIPGRQYNSFDILNGYQFAFQNNRLALRQDFWNQLQSLIHEVPSRNFLCVAGDYNTSLPIADHRVGFSHYWHNGVRTSGPTDSDWRRWYDILEMTDLIPFNTWQGKLGPLTGQNQAPHGLIFYVFEDVIGINNQTIKTDSSP